MVHEHLETVSNDTTDLLLSVRGLSKKFCRSFRRSLFYGVRDIASELVGARRQTDRLRPGEFWALSDVTCQLRRGEALGLVGANGAGKSTLLRLVSGLIKPDAGEIRVRGNLAPLIALGAGFNPVLTGIENVYANMSILGLSTAEIDKRLDEMLDFAEIDPEALNAPLRTYSSGMAARLGFACAVHTDPDVLLIDEVLAVGDVKFRLKCYRKLAQLRENGTAFALVSHNPHVILSICTSAVYLSDGRLVASGEPDMVMKRYERDLFALGPSHELSNALVLPPKESAESAGVDILKLSFRNEHGNGIHTLTAGSSLSFCVSVKCVSEMDNVSLTLLVREQAGEGEWILRMSSAEEGSTWSLTPGEHELRVEMPYLGLRPGRYVMKLNVSRGALYLLDAVESFSFEVTGNDKINCSFYQPHAWRVVSQETIGAA